MTTDLTGVRVLQVLGSTTGDTTADPGRHVRVLADALVARGAQVTVCAPQQVGETFGFAAGGARFDPIAIGARPAVSDRAATARLRAWARHADVVHAHGERAGALAALGCSPRVPLVLTRHAPADAHGPTSAFRVALSLVTARRANVVCGVSSDLVAAAEAQGARKTALVSLSAPESEPPTRSADEVRDWFDLGERPLVVTAAPLDAQHGYQVLVEAATLVADRPEPPLIVAAGDGPDLFAVAALVRDRGAPVRLLGHRDDVVDLLGAADVAVLASRWEASPPFLHDALRAGVPFVGTDAGGIADLARGAALLVPYGDPAALAHAIARVLDEPSLAARLRRRCAAAAAALPTDASVVRQVVDVYAGLGVAR